MLQFDEASHRYTWCGQVVPSVTQILAPLYDWSGVPPAVLQAKADIGTRTHLACELDDAGTLDEATVADDIRPYLEGWRKFKAERKVTILQSEARVYSPTHRYAGTLDRVIWMDDEEHLIDIKTSATVHPAVGPQTAAYANAAGAPLIKRGFVQLLPDGGYRHRELTSGSDWVTFQACLLINRFKGNPHV